VCTATADHTLSPALAARATACLQIEARTAADLATADGAIAADDVARFVVQTQGMTDASRCADPAMLLAMPAPPVDPAQLAAVEAARAALAAAAATLSGGNVSGATRLLASAEHSPAAADPAIAARITLVRAMLAEESDQLPTAEQGFEDAYYAARAIDDLDVSLAAVAHLVTIADEDDADRAKAERWIKDGVADAERSRARAPHRAATVFVAAAAASSRTHSDRAAAWSASALALLGTAPSLAHVSALGIAGEVACARGDTATCFADHDAAIAEARTLLGPHHIRVAYLLQNAALDYMDAGRANQAVARAREAVELLRATRESSALDRLNSLNTLAALLESSGQAADRANARAILEDVHRQLVAKLGADDPQLVIVESNLATAYTDDQELDRARAMIEHARTVAEANLGKDDPGTADVLFNLADTEEAQAQFAAALPIAKHVVDIRAATAPGTVLHGQALAQVARLENALGDPVSARTHARAALALPALRDPIVARARAQLELARASARSHDAVPAAEGVAALADARAIFVAFELPDGVAACDRVTLRP
jgi:tetratricopeptide (TPR) repeat protein